MRQVQSVVDALIRNRARRATKFVSPTLVVRATRRRYHGGLPPDRYGFDIVLNIGQPNANERRFIKSCQRAGEPFPVRKIKLGMLRAKAKAKRKTKRKAKGN